MASQLTKTSIIAKRLMSDSARYVSPVSQLGKLPFLICCEPDDIHLLILKQVKSLTKSAPLSNDCSSGAASSRRPPMFPTSSRKSRIEWIHLISVIN